jgi:hypothetical protein
MARTSAKGVPLPNRSAGGWLWAATGHASPDVASRPRADKAARQADPCSGAEHLLLPAALYATGAHAPRLTRHVQITLAAAVPVACRKAAFRGRTDLPGARR